MMAITRFWVDVCRHRNGLTHAPSPTPTSLACAWLHLSGCTATDSSRYRRRTAVRLSRSSTSLMPKAAPGESSSLRMHKAVRSSLVACAM